MGIWAVTLLLTRRGPNVTTQRTYTEVWAGDSSDEAIGRVCRHALEHEKNADFHIGSIEVRPIDESLMRKALGLTSLEPTALSSKM